MTGKDKQWVDFCKEHGIVEIANSWSAFFYNAKCLLRAMKNEKWMIFDSAIATLPAGIIGPLLWFIYFDGKYTFNIVLFIMVFLSVLLPIMMYSQTVLKLFAAERALRKLWKQVSSQSVLPETGLSQTGNLGETKAKQLGGAPRQWDWDGALLYLAALAHDSTDGLFRPDGKEPTASDIAKILRGWFIDQTDNAPADSTLRQYGSRFLQALDVLKRRSANN